MEPRNHYQPLRSNNGQQAFRLLNILPGQPFEPIVCQSYVASLSDCPRKATEYVYDAVSYAWEPAAPTHEIVLDAWPSFIRENLWAFVRQQRDSRKSVVYWIDALCVDQCSLTERASQVQLMHRIYSDARRVLVWLGPADRYSEAAMQLIDEVAVASEEEYRPSESALKALLSWSHRPYWTQTFSNGRLYKAFYIRLPGQQCDFLIASDTDIDGQPSCPALLITYCDKERWATTPLATLLIQNRHTKCHDPRDKVYAMLGLVQEPEFKRQISISYTKDCRQLLFEVVEYCQIPDKDTMRFAQFLANLFQIRGEQKAPPCRAPSLRPYSSQEKEFLMSAFSTGEIICCSLGRATLTSFQSGGLNMINGTSLLKIYQDTKDSKICKILRDIEKIDKKKLEMAIDIRTGINERNWSGAERGTLGLGSHKFCLVTVLNSSGAGGEALVGLAIGDIQKGDTVFHFLGQETAIAWRRGNSRTGGHQITGFVVCIAGDWMENRKTWSPSNRAITTQYRVRLTVLQQ